MKTAEGVYRRIPEMDPDRPLRLKFAPDAQALFIEWLTIWRLGCARMGQARSCRRIWRSIGS